MKGLLLKDWYLSLKYYKGYFLVLLVFAGMTIWAGSNPFFIAYPFMLISMMAPGLQTMDEGYKWDVYCGTMPCTKRQIVTEKYLYGLLWALLGLTTVTVSQVIRMVLNGGILWGELGSLLTVCLVLTFFLPTISLPFTFKFGAEKGRISQYLIIGCVCAGATIFSLREPETASAAGSGPVNALLVLGTAVLFVLSWFLSVRFYEQREIR